MSVIQCVCFLEAMSTKHVCDVSSSLFSSPHPRPGGDAGEKVRWLLRKSQSSEDHPDGLQAVSHEQEL